MPIFVLSLKIEVNSFFPVPWMGQFGALLHSKQVVDKKSFFKNYSASASTASSSQSSEEETCSSQLLSHLLCLTTSLLPAASPKKASPNQSAITSPSGRELRELSRPLLQEPNLEHATSAELETRSIMSMDGPLSLWLALLRDEEKSVIVLPNLVRFLTLAYSRKETSACEKMFIKTVFLRITRGGDVVDRSTLVLETLMKLLRSVGLLSSCAFLHRQFTLCCTDLIQIWLQANPPGSWNGRNLFPLSHAPQHPKKKQHSRCKNLTQKVRSVSYFLVAKGNDEFDRREWSRHQEQAPFFAPKHDRVACISSRG